MNHLHFKGRALLGLIFAFSCVLVNPSSRAVSVDDWAAPIANAQKLFEQKLYKESLKEFTRQADKGNGLAQFNVALFYDLGWGIKPDRNQACQWYQKSAESNTPAAMQAIGQCFLNGDGVKKNKQVAFDWFIKAFEQGIAEGGCLAGELLLKGEVKINANINGETLCLNSAQQGSVSAQSLLALWYFEGKYLAQDYQKAFNWLQVVASDKSPGSAYLLAKFYDQGIGMTVNEQQALYWYEIAASGQYIKAYLPTALLYWKAFIHSDEDKETKLAKSYLWAKSLSLSSTSTAEKEIANKLLTQIMLELPQAWLDDLDKKVVSHVSNLTLL